MRVSGTPIQNSVDDLVSVCRFLDPALKLSPDSGPQEIRRTIKPFFLRRRKKDVLSELLDKTREDVWLEMDDEQRAEHDAILARRRSEFLSGQTPFTRMHIFQVIQQLKQVCNFAPGKSTSPKLERLLEQLEEILQENKACVFAHYVGEGVDKLRQPLSKHGLVEVKGGTPPAKREKAVNLFQHDASVRIFLGSTLATNEAITLTAASYVFHFDHWWNPFVAWQAEDRVHRKGQLNKVTVYYYWMQDSYEERIYEILEKKGLLHDAIIEQSSEKEIDGAISLEDWCQVLGLDYKSLPIKPPERREGQTENIGEVYQALRSVSPEGFERLIAELLRRMGYNARVVGRSHDGGVDIRASRATVGGEDRLAVQCKRREQVGVETARELLGTVAADSGITKGMLVVSGRLTTACSDFIRQHGQLAAMEGVELAKHVIELGISLVDDQGKAP